MAPTRSGPKPAGSGPKATFKKRPSSTATSSSTAPKQKRKFIPKTHTTAGVAAGKKKKKDPKKRREADLAKLEKGLPRLNMVTPAGVVKPRGGKKGKVFVEDKEKMMSILARVNDSKDGQIQSKLERSRYLETIREARRKEEETRYEQRKSKMETAKDTVRNKRKRKSEDHPETEAAAPKKSFKKKVSFA